MKVALACPYSWDSPGGVQVHVRQLAGELRRRGHRVLILAPARRRPAESFVRAVGRPVPIPFNGSVAPICFSPASRARVRSALRSFAPDVVHAHEPLVPGTGMFAALAGEAPVVATFHAYADRAPLFSAAAPALRPVWRRLDLKVAVSEAAASFVAERFPWDGMRIVPNGVDVELFARAEPADLPAGDRILFVNRLEPRKGFRVMVEAFRRLGSDHPEAILVVAGDGPERSAVARLPLELRERVVMLGNVSHPELPPYHHASRAFCAPATGRESFGIVLVEAMAAGLPVVASDIAGYREVVRDGVEGRLVPPGDPGELARGIARILDDDDLARSLGSAGRKRAGRYSWDVIGGEIESVYEEAVGGSA